MLQVADVSLVLQQLIFLAELPQLRAHAPLGTAQRADLTAQVLLHLSARLQVSLQLLYVLLKPDKQRKRE